MANFYGFKKAQNVVLSFNEERGGINLKVAGYDLSKVEKAVIQAKLGSKVGYIKSDWNRELRKFDKVEEIELPEVGLGFTYHFKDKLYYCDYSAEAWEIISKSPLLNNIVTAKPKALTKKQAEAMKGAVASRTEAKAARKAERQANAPKKSSRVAELEAKYEEQSKQMSQMMAMMAQLLSQSEASKATPKAKPMAQKVVK